LSLFLCKLCLHELQRIRDSGALKLLTRRGETNIVRFQYLYFCTSKALSTWIVLELARSVRKRLFANAVLAFWY
jgi:hypothetical protein